MARKSLDYITKSDRSFYGVDVPRVTAAHAQEIRVRIVAAAARVFSEKGYHSSTIADVVREAGLSVGANLDTLAAEQGQVLNVRAISVNRDSAVLGFVAPDAEGCPVDWSVNGSASATRVTNLGGARSQQVELSDLPSDSEISARILCRSAQPLVTFRTLP